MLGVRGESVLHLEDRSTRVMHYFTFLNLSYVFLQVNKTLRQHAHHYLRRRLQRVNDKLQSLQRKYEPLTTYSAVWDMVVEMLSYGPLTPTVPGKVT